MHSFALLFAGYITLSSAQSTTTLFLPGFDQQAIYASVAGSDATATTYALGCPSGTDATNCGVPPSFTFTQGPATAHFTYSASGSFQQIDCSLGGMTTAVCTITATPAISGTSVTSTELSGTLLASQFQVVTLTDSLAVATGSAQSTAGLGVGGADSGSMSLTQATLLTGTAQSTTMAIQTSTPSTSRMASTTSGSPTSSATAAAATTKTSTAGMPQITGNAGWAAGGVALALAMAGL